MSKPADLVQGTLNLLILKILALEPLHGWAISQRLKQVSGDVLQVSDGSLYPHKGNLLLADRQVDVKTGTIRVAAVFPNPGNILRPGFFARVRAVTKTKQGALLVPQRAITELQGQYQLAVVGSDNKIEIRSVKVGERAGNLWVIDKGLQPGESVVVEGLQKVKPGMTVNPKPFQEPPKQAM